MSAACANRVASLDWLTDALCQNRAWATKVTKKDPDFFRDLKCSQQPKSLWIGCSDSRCPETTLLSMKPGDVFVHRNIANILHPADLNSAAVIEYAIHHLKVKHVVVCGHTNCGGVAAVVDKKQLGIIDAWLWPLRQLHQDHLEELQCMPDEKIALVELNVLASVKILKHKSVVLEAMQKGLEVHGLVYDVGAGILRELDIMG